jgi:tetratricopeptide (TPR) repeat protein
MKTVLALLLLSMVPLLGFAVGTGSSGSGGAASAGGVDKMTADDYYSKGLALSEAGKHSEALPQFQKAVDLKADFAEAYNMIGFTYRKLGKLNLSLRNYERALKIRPDFPEAYEYLGETYLAANDLVHAMENYLYLKNQGAPQAQELWEKIVDYVTTKARA